MKRIFLGLAFVITFGCATSSDALKSIKGTRISSHTNDQPNFYYLKYRPQMASRAPASFEQEKFSNKEVYFLGLWQQKKKMENLLGKVSNNVCPAFHNLLLETEDDRSIQSSNISLNRNWNKIFESQNPIANPVMVLRSSGGDDLISVYRSNGSIQSDEVVEALEEFYENSQSEVEQLCDTGSSEGYYVFQNMVEYYSNPSFMKSEKALKALLKITPVANYYVLKSLASSNGFVKADKFESLALKKLNASWFNNYLEKAYSSENRKVSSVSKGSGI